jgi:DNA repair exonuclease SbcCD ATPase subunit
MSNIQLKRIGIDVSYIKYLMEEAAKGEQRNQFVSQLSDVNRTIENMKKLLLPTDNTEEAVNKINEEISNLRSKDASIDKEINELSSALDINDRNRLLLSQVKHINVDELNSRHAKLSVLLQQLSDAEQEYIKLNATYSDLTFRLNTLTSELKTISDSYNQYVNTVAEIDKHDSINGRYKIIAEATSSTKGKPVIAIRETVEDALALTNRLLNIMYDGEIELLDPTIDENNFTLPFRCGSHLSADIRYGSQSEATLLSLALEMALSASLTQYNVCLVDEIDAYLDSYMHDSFLMMIQETMATLKMEQLFMISHSLQPGQYDHIVHTIDLSKK